MYQEAPVHIKTQQQNGKTTQDKKTLQSNYSSTYKSTTMFRKFLKNYIKLFICIIETWC